MTERERKTYDAILAELMSPCKEVAVPLAQCLAEARDCARCGRAAAFVARAVRAGKSTQEIATSYRNRFDPGGVRAVPADGPLARGPAAAPVTLVELVDLQCPACQAALPMVEEGADRHAPAVRVVTFLLAFPMHPDAEDAARAVYAAAWQGKGQEMLDALRIAATNDPTGGRTAFSLAALASQAGALGLDVGRFTLDEGSQRTTARLAADQKVFDDLKCNHTPTLFVNGRETELDDLGDALDDAM